jgi:hypothetical protein
MTEQNYRPASNEELASEARRWDAGEVDTRGWREAQEAIPRAASAILISIRVPAQMLGVLKAFARREGVGYQVLMKRWLDERIRQERDALAARQPVRLHQPELISVAAAFSPADDQILEEPEVG